MIQKSFIKFFTFTLFLFGNTYASPLANPNEPGAVAFNPPQGWQLADPQALPPSVKIMVVGKGEHEFPPSINLGVEEYQGTLKDYLKTIKAINDSQGTEWKDLGTVKTEAGNASLSQVDSKTEWGDIRMMHVILVKNSIAYILTAAALKDEFSKFYKEFFRSMVSLRINKNLYEMVPNPSRRLELEKAEATLFQQWSAVYAKKSVVRDSLIAQSVFESTEFQEKYWNPFKRLLESDFGDLGTEWQNYLLTKIRNQLIN